MRYILILLFCLPALLFSQTVLLEEYPGKDTIPDKYGPNRNLFHHLYLGYGCIVDQPEGGNAEIIYGLSDHFEFGYRYKYKISNTFSFGWDLKIASDYLIFKQNSDKTFPDTLLHNREKLILSTFGGDAYFRINYGRRGNSLGKYIDIVPFGDINIGSQYVTIDKFSNNNVPGQQYSKKIKAEYSSLGYIEPFQYGISVRIGFNRFIIAASYRLSDYIDNSYPDFPELPRLKASIQVALY